MEPTLDVRRLSDALKQLVETRAVLEARLEEILTAQKKIEVLMEEVERLGRYGLQVRDVIPHTSAPSLPEESPTVSEATTFTHAVIAVFEQRPEALLGVDDVLQIMQESRPDATKEKVRNALYYADSEKKLHRVQRGKFALKDTSTPGATGVDVNEESDSEGSSGEEGEGRDGVSALLHDQSGGSAGRPHPFDRDRD